MLIRFFRRHAPSPIPTTVAPSNEMVEEATDRSRRVVAAPPGPMFVKPALSTATRDYAEAVEAGRFDRLTARDLDRLYAGMGPYVWSWQRAKRLTSQPAWRASPNVGEAHERVRAELAMAEDVITWERAMVAIDAEAARAAAYGRPAPLPLDVPPLVLAAIEARRAAALERASRRGTATHGDGPRSRPASATDAEGPPPPAGLSR